MRRTIFLATALFTFVLGTMVEGVRSFIVKHFSETPQIEALVGPLDNQDELAPLRIGVFIGVDGVTLSADGTRFVLFDEYKDRENVVLTSAAELTDVTHQLRSAGLFEEAQSNSPTFISLPQNFSIVLAWPDKTRSFNWIPGDKCRVPEKYLRILEELNRNVHQPLLKNFIAYNRWPNAELALPACISSYQISVPQ